MYTDTTALTLVRKWVALDAFRSELEADMAFKSKVGNSFEAAVVHNNLVKVNSSKSNVEKQMREYVRAINAVDKETKESVI